MICKRRPFSCSPSTGGGNGGLGMVSVQLQNFIAPASTRGYSICFWRHCVGKRVTTPARPILALPPFHLVEKARCAVHAVPLRGSATHNPRRGRSLVPSAERGRGKPTRAVRMARQAPSLIPAPIKRRRPDAPGSWRGFVAISSPRRRGVL